MAAGLALGRLINIVHTLGDSTYVNLQNAGAVTFVCKPVGADVRVAITDGGTAAARTTS